MVSAGGASTHLVEGQSVELTLFSPALPAAASVLKLPYLRYTRAVDSSHHSSRGTYGILQFLRRNSEPGNKVLQQVRRCGLCGANRPKPNLDGPAAGSDRRQQRSQSH